MKTTRYGTRLNLQGPTNLSTTLAGGDAIAMPGTSSVSAFVDFVFGTGGTIKLRMEVSEAPAGPWRRIQCTRGSNGDTFGEHSIVATDPLNEVFQTASGFLAPYFRLAAYTTGTTNSSDSVTARVYGSEEG